MTKFCISVPVGAYHPLLRECLKSLAVQNPRPEVAFLDASGDPRVSAAADEFSDLLTYRRHGPDGGQSDAIIEGWKNLDGDVLGWLNADDALYPDTLARMAAVFEARPSLGVAYGHSTIIDDDNNIKGYHWAVEPPGENILFADTISQPSCFFRRSLYDAIGGLNADLHYTMDWDLWVRFWRARAEFHFVDESLSRVLWTAAAKTGGFNKARRREIDNILAGNVSVLRRIKSRIGFGLHYLFEYVLPDGIARPLRRTMSRSGAVINGLGRNGEITGGASLPLLHYRDAPLSRVVAVFEKDARNVSASLEGRDAKTSTDGPSVTLELDRPLCSGDVISLRIENQSSPPALLCHVSLV